MEENLTDICIVMTFYKITYSLTTPIEIALMEQINLTCQLPIGSAYRFWSGVDLVNYFELICGYHRSGPASGLVHVAYDTLYNLLCNVNKQTSLEKYNAVSTLPKEVSCGKEN